MVPGLAGSSQESEADQHKKQIPGKDWSGRHTMSFLAPEVRSIHNGTRPEGTDQNTRRLSVHQVKRQDENHLEPF